MSGGRAEAVRKRGERGFSLVETIVALGLLGGVLISITSLFILGGRSVKSGRTSSEALAVSRAILEEMDGWSFRQTYSIYGYDGLATSYAIDSRTNSYCTKWQSTLASKLRNSYANIDVTSLGTGPPNLSVTRAMRVVVTVNWTEGSRPRSVRLGTVRM